MADVRYKWVCSHCGSDSITFTANVEWDVDKQTWIVPCGPFDDEFCEDCQGETTAFQEVIEE